MSDRFAIELPPALRGVGSVDVALILGSGLSDLADAIESPTIVSFSDIEGFPACRAQRRRSPGTARGREARRQAGRRVPGPDPLLSGLLGDRGLVPGPPCGSDGRRDAHRDQRGRGIAPELAVGDLVLISDHVNLMGDNPLKGWPGPEGGNPFIPMRDAYDPELRALALACSADTGVPLVPQGRVLRASRPELRDTRRGSHASRSWGRHRRDVDGA